MAGQKRIAVVGNWEKSAVRDALETVRAWCARNSVDLESNLREEELVSAGAAQRSSAAHRNAAPGAVAPASEADPVTSPNTTLAARIDERGSFGGWEDDELARRYSGADLILTLGGDGTLLYAVRFLPLLGEVPVLSINYGTIGFNTQAFPPQLVQCLDAWHAGDFQIERRFMLGAALSPLDEPSAASSESKSEPTCLASTFGLNDIVVAKSAWGHMVHLRVEIDGQPATDIDADSLVLATPTGSSGYNYAAGGPIVVPWMDAIIMNAICSHRQRILPVVLAPDTQVSVTVRRHEGSPVADDFAQVLVDGQIWCTLAPGAALNISRAPLYLPLVSFDDHFFQKLRERLRWGGLS